jgi:hypothetical protein
MRKALGWRGRYEGKLVVGTLSGRASASNDLVVLTMVRELQQWAQH